jgi:quercetin dioxygenase-like cupin family protein
VTLTARAAARPPRGRAPSRSAGGPARALAGRALAGWVLAAGVLAGCAQPGQLGHPLPAAPAPAPVAAPAAAAAPAPDPAVLREPVTGTVDSRVTIRTPGPTVYSVRTVVLAPGEVLGWRRHPGTEMAVVRSGAVTLRRQGACGPVAYTSGQALFVGDAVPHRMSNEGSEPAELLVTMLLTPDAPESTDTAAACAPG